MFLINFNQWKCACVGINNWAILLRARYKCNHNFLSYRRDYQLHTISNTRSLTFPICWCWP